MLRIGYIDLTKLASLLQMAWLFYGTWRVYNAYVRWWVACWWWRSTRRWRQRTRRRHGLLCRGWTRSSCHRCTTSSASSGTARPPDDTNRPPNVTTHTAVQSPRSSINNAMRLEALHGIIHGSLGCVQTGSDGHWSVVRDGTTVERRTLDLHCDS